MEQEDRSSNSDLIDESINSQDFEMGENEQEDDLASIGSLESLEEEQEDQTEQKEDKNEIDLELKKAKDTKFSNDIWRSLMSLYSKNFYYMDKINKMPQIDMMNFFENSIGKICEENLKSKIQMMNLIEDLTAIREKIVDGGKGEFSKFYEEEFLASKLKKKGKKIRNPRFDCERAFAALESEFSQRQGFWEKESEKWFTKTSLDIMEKDKVSQDAS